MAPRALYSCPSCQRHLFTHQQICPFCDETQKERGSRLSAGLLALGLGVAVSGCEQEEVESRDGGVNPGVDMLLDQSVRSDLDTPQPPYGSPELDMRLPTDIDAPQPAYGGPELTDFAVDRTVEEADFALDQSVRTDLDTPQPPYGSPELDMRAPQPDMDAPQPAYGAPELDRGPGPEREEE